MTKGCGVTLRHASVSIPVHSQSTISTTTVHGAVVSVPSQLGCSGGGGGESGDGDVALDRATNIKKYFIDIVYQLYMDTAVL